MFKTNKGIYAKIVDRHITKGKPRAAMFAVSTDVRCKSPEYGILAVLILLFYTIDTTHFYNGLETVKFLTLNK